MAILLTGPNKMKALRYLGVAKNLKGRIHNPMTLKTLGATATGMSPHVRLNAKGEDDALWFTVWDNTHNYIGDGINQVGDVFKCSLIYGDPEEPAAPTIKIKKIVQQTTQLPTKEWIPHSINNSDYGVPSFTVDAGTPGITAVNQVTGGLTRLHAQEYFQAPITRYVFAGTKVIWRLENKFRAIPSISNYATRFIKIEGKTYILVFESNPTRSLSLIDLAEETIQTFDLPDPPWATPNRTLGGVSFNKDGTKLVLMYGYAASEKTYGRTTIRRVRTGYREFSILIHPNLDGEGVSHATMQVFIKSTQIVFDNGDPAKNSRHLVAAGYNAETTTNELVVASIYTYADTSADGVVVNPRLGSDVPMNFDDIAYSRPEYCFGAGDEDPETIYTEFEEYVTAYGNNLVFESENNGEILNLPLDWHPYGFGVSRFRNSRTSGAYIRGIILSVDVTCRGVSYATSSASTGATVSIKLNTTGYTDVPMPEVPDFLEVKTTAFGITHTIYSAGAPTSLATRPAYPRIHGSGRSVDMRNGLDSSFITSVIGDPNGGVTIKYQSALSVHPHYNRKLWAATVDPDDLFTPFDYGSERLNYPEAWISSMKSEDYEDYGGVYDPTGKLFSFKDLYYQYKASQDEIILAGGEPKRPVPDVQMGNNMLQNAIFGSDSLSFGHSKIGVGLSWTVFDPPPKEE